MVPADITAIIDTSPEANMHNIFTTSLLALAAVGSAHNSAWSHAHASSSSASSTAAAVADAAATAAATATPGYFTNFTTLPGNNTFSFGRNYAVLNLDMITGLVGYVNETAAGKAWIHSVALWINATHAQNPPPLSIFTRIYFQNTRKPEIGPKTPFAAAIGALGNATTSSPQSQLYPAFVELPDYDVDLQKTRYYAGAGNELEEILSSQLIDTVILSGIRTSGVILSTAYRLFDLNYNVYVISNNTIETPSDVPGIDAAIKEGILPKLPANVITVEQAIAALNRSGPAIY